MRRLLIPILLLLILHPASASALERDWPSVTVAGHDGVVMPRDVAADAVTWIVWPDDEIEGYWLPGEPWLEKAEDAVERRSATIPDPDRAPMTGGYRQYAGFVEHGERKILINSFCRDFENWRSQYIMVMDGGPCFWNAIYNVDTAEVERLSVNGVA